LIYLTFFTNTNSRKEALVGVHEPSFNIISPLIFLAFGSIFIGYLGKEMIISNVIHPIVPGYIKTFPLILSLLGGILAFFLYSLNISFYSTRGIFLTFYTFFNSA
jgi:NADH:ubiquinone oxidoreductase subunit 5 (subunit L)/multisubunit Na+/H+ antiporter MnhA subunit